jgi:haloacetate dehalogenase
LLLLWSSNGIAANFDVISVWREQANHVSGFALGCGHFLAEEQPYEIASQLRDRLTG